MKWMMINLRNLVVTMGLFGTEVNNLGLAGYLYLKVGRN